MSNELTVFDAVKKVRAPFEKIATEQNIVKWASESQFAIQALQSNSYLAKSDIKSVQDSIINVASVGLTLNPAYGYAYLVPEFNNNTKTQECKLRISFQGLIKIACETVMSAVSAEVVYENDTFIFKGPFEKPEFAIGGKNAFTSDRGEPVGVFCWAITKDGVNIVDMMKWDEVLKIKQCAKTDVVWKKWPLEMAKKAIIKRASKQWPKSDRVNNAVDVINSSEGSEPIKNKVKYEDLFLECIKNKNSFSVTAVMGILDSDEQTDLFNCFEKGQKSKGKDTFRELNSKGVNEWNSFLEDICSYIREGDKHSIKSEIEGFEDHEKAYLKKRLEQKEMFKEFLDVIKN